MMEFTYDGLVRQGFGFYNPNHAAAFICALLPFLWSAWFQWRGWKARVPVALGIILLLVALAATFSRTGLVVLAGELLLYLVLRKGAGWRILLGMGVAAIATAAGFGALTRFTVDASLVNRLEIWRAGLALFAANLWQGVGVGNSGRIASAFLLPEGIECRTLVNSHLTLLVECGLLAGFLWLLAQVYALLNSWRYPAVSASLAGLSISASMGSIFDWPVLFDFREFGGLPVLNFVLSWALLLLFAGLTAFLVCVGVRKKKGESRLCGGIKGVVMSAGACACFIGFLFCVAGPGPEVGKDFIVARVENRCPTLVLYGGDWNLRQVRRFLPKTGYRVPVQPWNGEAPHYIAERIMLFGDCASYASDYPQATVTLVAPPEHFQLPPNVSMLWLRSFENHESLLLQVRAETINVDFF